MKTQSTVQIPALQDLGTGRWYFHFNHETIKRENGDQIESINEAETVTIEGKPDRDKIISALKAEGVEITDDISKQVDNAVS